MLAIDVLVEAWPTDCDTALDVLPSKLLLPPYTAVMLCDPSASAEVENVATPPESEPVPIVVEPSLNVTVPVAVPAPGALTATVAVNVTDSPTTDGFCDDASDVLVEAVFTVWLEADDVLPV